MILFSILGGIVASIFSVGFLIILWISFVDLVTREDKIQIRRLKDRLDYLQPIVEQLEKNCVKKTRSKSNI